MFPTQLPTRFPLPTTDAHREPIPVCDCGQDLDACAGAHCPRCGRTLHDVHHLPSAA